MTSETPTKVHPDVTALCDRRLVVVTGKGGVGKTSVAVALAMAAAAGGKRVLLAQFESPVDVGNLLSGRAVGTEIRSLGERLAGVNMSPRASLREFGMQVFRLRAIQRAVMENRMVRHFLRAIPGLDDYAMLGKAWHHATELEQGRPRYDLVVVDGPATGQMLQTLSVPRSILQVVPESMLTRDARAIQRMLQDPAQTGFMIVTLAEELPVGEALDLERALRADLGMPVWGVVVNQIYPVSRCPALGSETGGWTWHRPELESLVRQARLLARRRAINEGHLKALRAQSQLPVYGLPLLFVERLGWAQLSGLAAQIAPLGGLGGVPEAEISRER